MRKSDTIPITLHAAPTPDFPHIFEPFVKELLAQTQTAASPAEPENAPAAPVPVWKNETGDVRLYQGDALQLLARARPETFDLIFADPPYFLSSNGMTCQNGKMVSVNKGLWDKTITFEAMHEFNLEWLGLCRTLLKPDGALWVTGTLHNIYSVGFALQTLGYKILNDIAWYKVNPPPHLACRYFTHSVETVLWARKSPQSKHTFHYAQMKADNGNKQMQSLWHITPPKNSEKRFGKHPTQKPEALLDRIIRASTNPNDLILDPFMGSGTTGVVAARHNRRFVGFEQESEYIDLAIRRIDNEAQQLSITRLGGGGGDY